MCRVGGGSHFTFTFTLHLHVYIACLADDPGQPNVPWGHPPGHQHLRQHHLNPFPNYLFLLSIKAGGIHWALLWSSVKNTF